MSVAFPVARVEIFRDVKFSDDDFQSGWNIVGATGTLETDGEIATLTIGEGHSMIVIEKDCEDFDSTVYKYAIVRCTELTGSGWRFAYRRKSDHALVFSPNSYGVGITTILIPEFFEGEIERVGLRVDGTAGQYGKFDYEVVSAKQMIAPTDDNDVLNIRVHSGVLNEVGSFELTLQNFNAKYAGWRRPSVGDQVKIWLGREGSGMPKVLTGRVEEVRFEASPVESYVRLWGRDKGEELFRRTVTKTYVNMKGEAIVKDLIENFTGLSHYRGSTDLIESTDTTFSLLEYENTPVFDILKEIAKSSDKQGVIGFDFRIEPDGKFAFFPRNSKTSPISLTERIEVASHEVNITRVRNKVTVYGAAEKAVPSDKDAWTESVDPADGVWTVEVGDSVSADTGTKKFGSASIKLAVTTSNYYGRVCFTLDSGKEVDANKHPSLQMWLRKDAGADDLEIILEDSSGNMVSQFIKAANNDWRLFKIACGEKNRDNWSYWGSSFNWASVKKIKVQINFPGAGTGDLWIDGLFFNNARWSSTRENTTSQNTYGLRELVEVDEELHSDGECQKRADALLEYLGSPAEHLTINTTVLDYGNNWLLPGDKIHVTLPNEDINADYRILSVEFQARSREQTLEITLELGKEPPKIVNLLSNLCSEMNSLARYKAGPTGAVISGGGGGGGSGGMEQHGNEWHDPDMALQSDFNTHTANQDAHHPKIHGNESHSPTFSPVGHIHPCSDLTDHNKATHDSLNINADTLDGSHASAFAQASHTHVEADITNLDHNAQKIKGKAVDDSGIGDGKVLGYNASQDKIVYMTVQGGGGGAHADTHESGGSDEIDGWIRPSHIGPRSDSSAIVYFRTQNIAGDTPLDHRFAPTNNERGFIGTPSARWSKIYTKDLDMTGSLAVSQLVVSPNPIYAYGDIIMNTSTKNIYPSTNDTCKVGTSTNYFDEMHADNFVTHSMKPIPNALSKLKGIIVNDKKTFPPEVLSQIDLATCREELRTRKKQNILMQKIIEAIKKGEDYDIARLEASIKPEDVEPTDAELQSALEKATGVSLVQTISLLIEAVKFIIAKLEALGISFD